MIEILLQFFGEFLLQVLAEGFLYFGVYSLAGPFRKIPIPWLAAIGYAIFGAAFGGFSLFFVPSYFINDPNLRILNLIVTPLLAGALMAIPGLLRAQSFGVSPRIDRFVNGYLFALAFGLMRYLLAR